MSKAAFDKIADGLNELLHPPEVTRIAPSPTGLFHLGTARTAYINYLAAKSSDGKFILRIDDTDVARNKEEYTQVILDTLDWLGLEPDEIFYQSKRTDIYAKVAESLVESKKAFVADNGAIILKGPTALPETFLDTIAGPIKITETNYEQIRDRTVLVRGGDTIGQPTYQFCSVVDDYYMDICNIIRGVDHITNTPKQIAIWQAVAQDIFDNDATQSSWEPKVYPKFTHMGLIFKDKKKLSKRDGAASLLWYKEQGYKPEAVLNFMLILGWSLSVPRNDKALEKIAGSPISKDMAIELFPKGTLKASPCNFDMAKLDWLQKRYSK